ncbi:MAG TPA: chemotaxis protein CheW [Ktedonobacteraceae bacterium]|nr:chemotaxis protein CheW [Ktedonobacteraceae bacterium]
MSNKDLNARQQQNWNRQAVPQGADRSQSLSESGEARPASRASIAALQSQLAQLTQQQVRAAEVAPSTASAAVIGEQYLIFSLLDREFALKAEHIQGVERLVDVTTVPHVASWIKGVMNLRGSIASVVDLRVFLGMEALPHNPRTRLLSVQYNEMVICLLVDGVSEMVPIARAAITPLSVRQTAIPLWAAPYASGSALVNNRFIVLLDASRLLLSDRMQRYEALN